MFHWRTGRFISKTCRQKMFFPINSSENIKRYLFVTGKSPQEMYLRLWLMLRAGFFRNSKWDLPYSSGAATGNFAVAQSFWRSLALSGCEQEGRPGWRWACTVWVPEPPSSGSPRATTPPPARPNWPKARERGQGHSPADTHNCISQLRRIFTAPVLQTVIPRLFIFSSVPWKQSFLF